MAGGEFSGITPGGGPLSEPSHNADLELYERLDGLCGQEDALLKIPAEEREPHHHERLHRVEQELDRAFERLRDRAARRSPPQD